MTNSGNAYVCITSGTSASSGGPTTTSNNITDGTAHWQYLGAANYTSMNSWASGIPGTLTQPIVGQVLAAAFIDITSPAYTPVLALSGHSTTPTNTITLTAFPGYGIRDTLGALGETAPLFLNTANGITFVGPAAAANPNDYFLITDANVIFDGLMFQDLDTTSDQTSLVTTNSGATNFQLRDCIVDGTPQTGGAWMVQFGDQALCANCLFVDRSPSPVGGFAANLSYRRHIRKLRVLFDERRCIRSCRAGHISLCTRQELCFHWLFEPVRRADREPMLQSQTA